MSDKTQRVRGRAYQLWQVQGEPEGQDVEHWLQAEREYQENRAGSASEGANEAEGSQTGARAYDEAATAFAHGGRVAAAAANGVNGARQFGRRRRDKGGGTVGEKA
jgi:hypothetical protein